MKPISSLTIQKTYSKRSSSWWTRLRPFIETTIKRTGSACIAILWAPITRSKIRPVEVLMGGIKEFNRWTKLLTLHQHPKKMLNQNSRPRTLKKSFKSHSWCIMSSLNKMRATRILLLLTRTLIYRTIFWRTKMKKFRTFRKVCSSRWKWSVLSSSRKSRRTNS